MPTIYSFEKSLNQLDRAFWWVIVVFCYSQIALELKSMWVSLQKNTSNKTKDVPKDQGKANRCLVVLWSKLCYSQVEVQTGLIN